MILTLGFSTCPNDTFMFDALVNGKIDTEGIQFQVFYHDIENLNKKAFDYDLDITKISYNALTFCTKNYALLDSGSALGYNVGPLLVKLPEHEINEKSLIGIPGRYTTANMLFEFAFPKYNNKKEFVFSDIENAVINKNIDAGLVIHESRFTYQKIGLKKVIDLGEYWGKKTDLPIPLGGIAIKRNISKTLQYKINDLVRKSIEYAFQNPDSSKQYIKKHAQEMNEHVIKSHIDLYVNKFSLSLGKKGKMAVEHVFKKSNKFHSKIFI